MTIPLVQGCLAATALVALAATRWRAAVPWLALCAGAQIAGLQLVEAGPIVRYERLWPHFLLGPRLPWFVVFSLLAAVTCVGSWRTRRSLLWPAWHGLGWASVLSGGAFLLAFSAFPQLNPQKYALEAGIRAAVAVVQLAALALAVRALPDAALEPVAPFLGRFDPARVRVVAFASAGLALVLSLAAYQAHPHVPDEVAYWIQAQDFSMGRISSPVGAVPDAFEVFMVPCRASHCFSVAMPGWSAVLSLGIAAGVPGLVNPLLLGVALWLAARLFARHLEPREANLALLLLAASPWVLFLGMSLMQHMLTLVLGLAAALATSIGLEKPGVRWAVAAGIALGALSLVRPQDAAALAPVLGFTALLGQGRLRLAPPVTMALSAMAVAALIGVHDHALVGDVFREPLVDYMDTFGGHGHNALGFGPDRGFGWRGLDLLPGHGLLDVVLNALQNATATQIELFGWGAGSLTLLALALPRLRCRLFDLVLWGLIASNLLETSLYWFSGGPDFGARYWFPMAVPLVVLTVRSLGALAPPSRPGAGSRLVAGVCMASGLALCVFVPWRAIDKYHHYRGMQPGAAALIASAPPGALLIVRGTPRRDYDSARVYAPLGVDPDAPLVARGDSPARIAQLLDAYSDRPVVWIDGPSLTGAGYARGQAPIATSSP